jgi:MFS family permease
MADLQPSRPPGTGPCSGIAAYGLFMLTVVYAFNFVDRQILVIPQEPIKNEMGLSDGQLGLLARIGVGIGEAGGSPPAHSMISDYYPPERRGTALAIYIRNHGLSVGEVGIILAICGGGGGMIGTFLGGFLADRLGVRDVRWYLWLPMLAGLVALPLKFPYLLLDDTATVIGFLLFVSIAINTYLGPCLAISHTLVPPAMRAFTSAILFFILNMIGLGLGPLANGLLSDLYGQYFGIDGLRYAMLTVTLLSSPSILLFWLAARRLPSDLQRR